MPRHWCRFLVALHSVKHAHASYASICSIMVTIGVSFPVLWGVGCDGADGLIHSFRSHLLKYFPPGVPETDMLLQSMHVRVRNGFRDCNLGYGLGYRVHSMSPTISASCKSGSALTSSSRTFLHLIHCVVRYSEDFIYRKLECFKQVIALNTGAWNNT